MLSSRCVRYLVLLIIISAPGSVAVAGGSPADVDTLAGIACSGSAQDGKSAIASLRAHAGNNHVRAQYQLGRCYENGWSVAKDARTAADLYRTSATGGDPQASLRLSSMYLAGRGMERDAAGSLRFLRKAADAGNPEAEYLVGWCYEFGVLDARSSLRADRNNVLLECLRRMIDAPSPGQMVIAQWDWSIGFQPVRPLSELADRFYTRSAGHGYAPASLWIITFSLLEDRDKHDKQMQESIQTLSKQDDPIMLALFEACRLWLRSTKWKSLLPADSARSVALLRGLAKKGDAVAMESLAGLENIADSAAARIAKGEDWRHDAFLARTQLAASGDAVSEYKTAKAYEEGKVVARDMRAAAHWYAMAAERNYPWAQIELAKCYDTGSGVEMNPRKAEFWRHRASCQGVR